MIANKQERHYHPYRHPSKRGQPEMMSGIHRSQPPPPPHWALSGTLFHGGINPLLTRLIWQRQGCFEHQFAPEPTTRSEVLWDPSEAVRLEDCEPADFSARGKHGLVGLLSLCLDLPSILESAMFLFYIQNMWLYDFTTLHYIKDECTQLYMKEIKLTPPWPSTSLSTPYILMQ